MDQPAHQRWLATSTATVVAAPTFLMLMLATMRPQQAGINVYFFHAQGQLS